MFTNRMKIVLAGSLAVSVVMGGCSATSRDVQTSATIASIGGTPGAGIIGLGAMAVGLATKVKYEMSDGIKAQLTKATKDKTVGVFMKRLGDNRKRFESGDWGEDDEVRKKNVAAYEAGETVGVVYGKGADTWVYVYSKTASVANIVTPAEFASGQVAKSVPVK